MRLLAVRLLQLVGQRHVGEHRRELLDGLLSALDLQLGDHLVLRVVADGQLVQQPLRQRRLVEVEEDILVLQVSEEANRLGEEGGRLLLRLAFQPALHLHVRVDRQVLGAAGVAVEHVLQPAVPRALERGVEFEARRHAGVELLLQREERLRVQQRVVNLRLVLHDRGRAVLDVGLELPGHVRDRRGLAREQAVHESELVVFLLLEHVPHPGLHLHDTLRRLEDELPLGHRQQTLRRRPVQVTLEA